MDRKEFLLKMGITAAAVSCGCLFGCYDDPASGNVEPPPSNVDFTIDLNAPENSALNNIGGSIYKNRILIGRLDQDSFIAVSQTCTHQGFTVQFQLNNNRIHCPNHGSNYRFDGSVINGPAESPLREYNTSLEGNILRIFS